ncbi:MAG TPA: hypothetical protein VMT57_05480 [Candidatus Thermoplasmatota archaeon]|nr:hypothetical protein [Candidatus Thermoplasmatota archaeon]
MEEKYKGNTCIVLFVCILLFIPTILPLDAGMHQTANAIQGPSLKQQAAISLCIFEKGTTRCYHSKLSVDDVTMITNLMMNYLEVQTTAPLSKVKNRLEGELRNSLHQFLALPDEAIQDVLSAFSTQGVSREATSMSRFSRGVLPLYEKKEKVVRASITSSGAGVLIPIALTPRPRLTAIWKADSGKTLATNWVTKYGYNATGPHLGVAVGFIGVGFSSRVPNEHQYVLVGGALLALLYGDTIVPIVPS